jgi:hypothetical protein
MKTFLTLLLYILLFSPCFAQRSETINYNDTSYLRILNGVIIENNYRIHDLGSIQCISDKKKIDQWGIKTSSPIMLVNFKSFKIEYQIDSVLYSQPGFISSFKFPSTIQLPITINGKLLSYEDNKSVLSKLKFTEIKDIKYVASDIAMTKYGVTPFGVIDLVLK